MYVQVLASENVDTLASNLNASRPDSDLAGPSFEHFIHYVASREFPIHQKALLRVGRIVHSSWRYFTSLPPDYLRR